MSNSTKPTLLFWIISGVALLWNFMGVKAYLEQAYMSDDFLSTLAVAEQAYFENQPAWVTAAFAIAVFAGALGCIALLFRKKIASTLFALSLFAVLSQSVYNFFIQEYIETTGIALLMPIMIIIVAFFLVWYARNATTKGWLS